MAKSTLPVGDGSSNIETFEISPGLHVPTSYLRARRTTDDTPVDLRATDAGVLRVNVENPASGGATEVTADRIADAVEASDAKTPALASGRVPVEAKYRDDVVEAVTNLAAVNATATSAVVRNGTFAVEFVAGFTGTAVFEYSPDGGTTWRGTGMARTDGAAVANSGTQSNPTTGMVWEGSIPTGATHVRVRASAWTSGTGQVRISQSATAYKPNPTVGVVGTVNVASVTSGARIGQMGTAAIWHDDSATALAAGASFTSAVRDLTGVATATLITNYIEEARFMCVSDVAGTLFIEVSRDNTTFRRIMAVDATNTGTGGLYVAEASYAPATRYIRYVYLNGAAAQAHFLAQSVLEG